MDKICVTCLSNERRLFPLKHLVRLIQKLNINELQDSNGNICWECHIAIIKFQKFRIQAKKAQEIMRQNAKFDDIKPLSSLIHRTKLIYDFEYNYNDRNTALENKDEKFTIVYTEDISSLDNLENELKTIKKEVSESADEFDTIIDEDLDVVKNISSTKRKVKRKTLKKRKVVTRKNAKINSESKEADKFETKVFTEEEMLKNREEKRNHPNYKKIPFKCDSCVLGFTRKETYNMHVEKKHDVSIGEHICDVCQTRFPTAKSCQRHRSKHYILHVCTLCKYETRALWSVEMHCRTKHRRDTRGSIHCVQCRTLARTPEDMAEHIRTEHTLHCNECGEKFKGKNTLRTHKARIHAMQRDYVCDICSKTFVTKTRLESHMVTHNASIAKNLSYCAICKVQYKNIYVYRSHLKNSAHHSERAYPCPECNKKFASKVYWTKHYNFYHLQKSEFSCEICNKLFISDWRLKNHKQKHHGLNRSRDHPCNICGKKFFTVSTLVGHQLTHSAQRSYMCEECGDTFKQRPALYTHARLVHALTKR